MTKTPVWVETIAAWIHRKYWKQAKATDTLQHAHTYLYVQYYSTASGRERGWLLPEVEEALDILRRLARLSIETSMECL